MGGSNSVFEDLSPAELEQIKLQAVRKHYKKGKTIFREGDDADFIYFVESGEVGISVQKFTEEEEISALGPGEYFGEMAVLYKNRRTATVVAREDTELLTIEHADFMKMMVTHPVLALRINEILANRNEELILKESLVDNIGLKGKGLHVSIKGDPSLRESAFSRERYESPVDRILKELRPVLVELLARRSVYQIFIGFNSGEVRTLSIFDPFYEQIHQASKLLDPAYVDRHFPEIAYQDKAKLVKDIYHYLENSRNFTNLPTHLKKLFGKYYERWEPVSVPDIEKTISKLDTLRNIPDFYLRNFTVSTTRDAIRMQFNCDGTHIVNSEDYDRFLQENI
jgi:CRP-like cAMP-binding protein